MPTSTFSGRFLGVPKARLVATLAACGATWIEDPSNEDDRFERVRVRKALAVLGEAGLTAEMIALSARRLRDVESDLARLFCSDALAHGHPISWHGGVMAEFEVMGPLFAGPYFTMRTLRQVLRGFGGRAGAAELSQLEQLAGLVLDARRRAACGGVTLGGCRIEFIGDNGVRVRVYREGAGKGLPVIAIAPGETVDWDGRRFSVTASPAAVSGGAVRALGMQGWADLKKAVPGLAALKWPAAAAATLPVIERGGEIVAFPGVVSAIPGSGETNSSSVYADSEAFSSAGRDFLPHSATARPGKARALDLKSAGRRRFPGGMRGALARSLL